ncbi:MAG: hypothetical protein RIG62_06360 [Cyclobacteriaceae bacterium]
MNALIHTTPALFIDNEHANIPYSTATLQLNRNIEMKRNTTPYSHMESGKFRRLFNRHSTAFRRW